MTKSELIEKLAQAEGVSARAAELAVNTVLKSMEEALVKGSRIEIRGLGSFKVKTYGARRGTNPKTGEPIQVAPKRLPFFKVGKELKDRLNGKGESITLRSVDAPEEDGALQKVAKRQWKRQTDSDDPLPHLQSPFL